MDDQDNRAILGRFFTAFAARDGNAMSACYHEEASFRDPVFELEGRRIGAMWRMLCARAADLQIEFSNLTADRETGRADWQACYSFSATGRPVQNSVHSEFRFRDGKIIEQCDRFDFWRWSRQALGPVGIVLGWTPWLHRKLRTNAARSLQQFIDKENRDPQ